MKHIENIAFVIPIHPPKYHYMYNLLCKLQDNKIFIDIFVVFSTQKDYELFTMKDSIRPFVITDPFETKCIVTFKKFFGLKKLSQSKYDYIICCDSEIDIILDNFTAENMNTKIANIFKRKTIFAGKLVSDATIKPAELFPKYYYRIKQATQDFSLFFWWSDLPVYRTSDLVPFFEMINYDNITYFHFDYIIYQYYLVLFHNFIIINTTPITNTHWSLEGLNTSDKAILYKLLEIGYDFSWNTNMLYTLDDNKSFIDSHKGFIIYHLDIPRVG